MEKSNSADSAEVKNLRTEIKDQRQEMKKMYSHIRYLVVETEKARKENIALRKHLERSIMLLLQISSKDKRPPTIIEFSEETGVGINELRAKCEYFPTFNWLVTRAGLKPRRKTPQNF